MIKDVLLSFLLKSKSTGVASTINVFFPIFLTLFIEIKMRFKDLIRF